MNRRALIIILVAAALIRLALLASAWNAPHRLTTPDSHDYIQLANSLVTSGNFGTYSDAEIFRTPGYPLFLVPSRLQLDGGWRLAAFVQIAIDVALVALTFVLASRLLDRRAAIWAAAFQAVSCVAVAASLRILSDGLFAFLLTVAILLLISHFRTGKWRPLLAAAVVVAVAAYVRPVGLAFAAVVVLVLLFRKLRFRRAGAFAGIIVLAVAPWVVRNGLAADYWGFSSFASDSMFTYSAPAVLAQTEGITIEEGRQQMLWRLDARSRNAESFGESYYDIALRKKLALEVLAEHPGTYAAIHLRGSAIVWLPGATDIWEILGITVGQKGTLFVLHERGLWAAANHYLDGRLWALWFLLPAVMLLGVKYVLAIGVVVRRVRLRMGSTGWLILLTVLLFAFAGGPAATPRFRVPIAPLISIAAGGGLAALIGWLRIRRES